MVYVLTKEGKALMPTERHGKIRRMLKNGRATVVKAKPFTALWERASCWIGTGIHPSH